MVGGAATAVAAAKMLAAAIPVAPMALFTVVEVNFTLTPLVSRCSFLLFERFAPDCATEDHRT